MDNHFITSVEELRGFYDQPSEMVAKKQIDHLDETCRAFLSASPFFLLATRGTSGADCSPRGDAPGFVQVKDDGKTLLIPDRAGNNRIDSLRNIVEDPRVGLLFLVPGITYTLRVNGTARLSVAPELLQRFVIKGKAPKCVISVSVEEAFTQCAPARCCGPTCGTRRSWSPKTPCRAWGRCSPLTRKVGSKLRNLTSSTGRSSRNTCTDRQREENR